MWNEVMRVAVSNGIFAVLFCSLLIYELNVSGKRETKYQNVIKELSQSLTALNKVEGELDDCERMLENISCDVKNLSKRKRKNENVDKTKTEVSLAEKKSVLYT